MDLSQYLGRLSALFAAFCAAFHPKNTLPCVGLVVLAGCFVFVIAPDELPSDGKVLGEPSRFPTIVLDPGHGGNDGGGRSHGLQEKDLTLDVAKRVEGILTRSGFTTVLTRKDDVYISLKTRATIANSYADAIFVSIHFNLGSRECTGMETHYARQKIQPAEDWAFVGLFRKPDMELDSGADLAAYIQNATTQRTEARNRGIRAGNLYVVRHVKWPAVLLEGGFMSNAMEARLLDNADYRDRIAKGIAEGIMTYLKSRPMYEPREAPQLAKVELH